MRRNAFLLALCLCCLSVSTRAGSDLHLTFTQISTKDGLSQNTVRAILEDEKGFIWAGTLDGLNRYDGYNIVSYKPEPGNLHSLADHRVKQVFRDCRGYLWIKTYKNEFSCYDPVTDSFLPYLDTRYGEGEMLFENYFEASSGDIWLWGNNDLCLRITPGRNDFRTSAFHTAGKGPRFLLEDSRGDIWIGGDYGLYQISEDRQKEYHKSQYAFTKGIESGGALYFSTLQSTVIEYDLRRRVFREIPSDPLQDEFLNIAAMNTNEAMIVTASSGIWVFDTAGGTFSQPEWAQDPLLAGNLDFLIDGQNGIWVYNHSGVVWYYEPASGNVRRMELIPPHIASIIDYERYNVLIDSEGLIWITTYGNGIFCYHPPTGHLQNYKYNANQNSPASDYLLSITEDRAGNIWLGSEYAGIVKIVKSPYSLQLIRPERQTSIGKNNNVRTVYIDRYDRVWLGTKNGSLYIYDPTLTSKECIYKDLNPYTIAEDDQNRLWVGTKGNGLSVIDIRSRQEVASYRNDPADNRSLSHNTVFSLLRDSRNRMWIGTFGGGICLAENGPQGISFKRFFFDEGNRSYIRHICEDSGGSIWLGTSDGVIRFNPDELLRNPGAYVSYRLDLNDPESINCNDIKSIFEDSGGNIWIGTAGGGLSRYVEPADDRAAHFVVYTMKEGMAGNFVSGIMEDKDRNLWISTESGICKFNPQQEAFTVFGFSEKTYGNHFNENANTSARNGAMFWGSLDGLLVLDPENFVADQSMTPVTFTNFSIYGQPAEVGSKDSPLTRSISYSDKIRLKHFQNTFTIEFSSLSFKDPARNRYTYQLDNYDKQWSQVSGKNTADYKNLPPGNYTFRVRGTNSDGTWSEVIKYLEIQIHPPWWKSFYAYLFYILLIAGAVAFTFKLFYQFNTLNNNIRLEKELTNHKLRFFTNISHEFRTPLTIIRSVIENMNDQADTPEHTRRQIHVLNRNSTLLTRLIDQLLEFRKLQNNVLTLDLENIDLVGFAREIYLGFAGVAEQKGIGYSFECAEESHFLFIDRRKMDKVLYNLLSNAFKFTPAGGKIVMSLAFDEAAGTCVVAVEDNGTGIEKEKQHLLFSRFMQIHFSYGGTGIGLALVKEFMEAHKGKVWYTRNEKEGRGSVFSIELSTDPETYKGENFISGSALPVVQPAESEKMAPTDEEDLRIPEIDDSALSNYKMLVIDDNDDIRHFLMEEFSRYFLVDVAEDGEKGLQKAIDTNPDLIICDVMMSGMDGFEVTRRLREDFQTCHIPIILLTAHSSTEHQVEGIQSGADAYITKPFSIKYLTARVFKLIEQREQLKKRFSHEYVLGGTLVTGTHKDKKFLDLINEIMEQNLGDPDFTVDKFAQLAQQRRTLFYKKVKGITGLSPNDLIKVKRLKRAAELLLEGDLTVAEISYRVGFDDPLYFSKCFKAQYNCPPSKYGSIPQDPKAAGETRPTDLPS